MVPGEPNPYEPPLAPAEPRLLAATAPAERDRAPLARSRQTILLSVLMIVAGAFFFVASFFVILGQGVESLVTNYRSLGWFPVAFMVFYGCAGGLTSAFHLSYLLYGRPQQHLAGLYAIVLALGLAGLAVAIMELVA